MKFDEARKIYNDLKRFESELPRVVSEMGAIGQNHFVKSFRNQGFEDSSVVKWQPRKREDRSRGGFRAILVKTGALRRSIRKTRLGKYGVTLLSDLPYAKIHNEGGEGLAWGKYRFKMPKRQFMGYSRVMNSRIERMINRTVKKVFRSE